MEIEAGSVNPNTDDDNYTSKMSRGLKRTLIVFNCFILILANVGAPLLIRLYFRHGGKRIWLSSFLQTAGFPIIVLPLALSYLHRRRADPYAKPVLITLPVFVACAAIGLMTGADDYLYAYGLAYLPVSTSALLISTQLGFTAFFAWLIVKQKFTPFSLNSVALLTVGAVILGLHTGSDRLAGVTQTQYVLGFLVTLAAAALYGLVLPLVELTYAKARQKITYTLVMEMQLVMGCFATLFCLVGMIVNNDFKVIPREATRFGLGETKYYIVMICTAILGQFFFLGAVGVIFCANTLLAGIIIAAFIPVVELFGVIFFDEKFTSEKGVALALSLWGLASYSYGEYLEIKEKKKKSESATSSQG